MTTKPPPLDPATRGLLEAERHAVSAPLDAKARALSRLLATIAEVNVAAARSSEGPPARARSLNTRASPSGASASGTSAWRAAWVARPLPLVVAFGLGAAAGVGAWSSWHPRVPVSLARPTSSAPEIASRVSLNSFPNPVTRRRSRSHLLRARGLAAKRAAIAWPATASPKNAVCSIWHAPIWLAAKETKCSLRLAVTKRCFETASSPKSVRRSQSRRSFCSDATVRRDRASYAFANATPTA